MSTDEHVDDVRAPIYDQPKTDVTAEITVPGHIWDRAKARHAAHADTNTSSTIEEYLLDHLLIEYEFTRATDVDKRE